MLNTTTLMKTGLAGVGWRWCMRMSLVSSTKRKVELYGVGAGPCKSDILVYRPQKNIKSMSVAIPNLT